MQKHRLQFTYNNNRKWHLTSLKKLEYDSKNTKNHKLNKMI